MKQLLLACCMLVGACSVINAMQQNGNPITGKKAKLVVSRFKTPVEQGLAEEARIRSKEEMNTYIAEGLLYQGREVAMPKSPFAAQRSQLLQSKIVESRLTTGTLGQNQQGDLVKKPKTLLELKQENNRS